MSSPAEASSALSGIPDGLRKPLLEEYAKICRNYRENRWEPAELNGGKLCEIVYCILLGHTNGTFAPSPSKPSNMQDACKALEKATAFPRSIRIQIPRMLMALYEVRNQRNVGHVGADVDPNHMDATLVLSVAKWIMGELVRVFHAVSTDEATAIVDALTERKAPILWEVGGRTRVLSGAIDTRGKLLVLLYGSSRALSTKEVAKWIEYANLSRFRTQVVAAAHRDNLLDFDASTDVLTLSPLGIRYVEENVPLEI